MSSASKMLIVHNVTFALYSLLLSLSRGCHLANFNYVPRVAFFSLTIARLLSHSLLALYLHSVDDDAMPVASKTL
mgnify:FL=1